MGGAGLSGLAAGFNMATVIFLVALLGFEATGLIALFEIPWAVADLALVFGIGFTLWILVTFLGDLACSAATPQDATISVRHRITVRMM